MNLHALDIVVLLLVASTALLGAKRGFVAEVLALFAWVAMVFALKIFHLPLSRALASTIGTPSGATVLAFARALGEFGATITFVSNIPGETQTLPLAIYTYTQMPGGDALALRMSVLSVLLSVLALALSEWLARRQRGGRHA